MQTDSTKLGKELFRNNNAELTVLFIEQSVQSRVVLEYEHFDSNHKNFIIRYRVQSFCTKGLNYLKTCDNIYYEQ